MKVAEVSKLLGCNQQTLRVAMQQGLVPFGVAVKKEGSNRYCYIFFPEKLKEYLGGQ